MDLRIRGRLPENEYKDTNGVDYDYIDWEFLSLEPEKIRLKLMYYKTDEHGFDRLVYQKHQTNKLWIYPATKTVSISIKNKRIDITNLLLRISNELFANCRERKHGKCILTKVEE